MMRLYFCLIFLSLISSTDCLAQQFVGDDLPQDYLDKVEVKKSSSENDWLTRQESKVEEMTPDPDSKSQGHLAPNPLPLDGNSNPNNREKLSGPDGGIPQPDFPDYAQISNIELIKSASMTGREEWTVSLYKDEFDYSSPANGFSHVFRANGRDTLTTSRADFPLAIKVGYNYFLWRWEYADLGVGIGSGVGYNAGKGVFPNGEVSNTKFYLYTIPVDLDLSFQVHANSWIKVAIQAGPSFLGILQYRTDLDGGDDRKFLRQGSYGYFGELHVGIGLSKMFPTWGRSLLDEYDVTKSYLVAVARGERYQNFKEPNTTVEGVSIGGGFAFEFF